MATPSSTDDRLPAIGDVIGFSFLWSHEQEAGLVEGVKDRRCVVVRVLPDNRVVAAPITSSEPEHDHKVSLSPGAFGLTRRSWIVVSELNVFEWPGYDLRPAREPMGAFWRYGRISDRIRALLADALTDAITAKTAHLTKR